MNEAEALNRVLHLFAGARNWKAYWSSQIRPFIRGDVLEAGSGIGTNTSILDTGSDRGIWVCLEPDPELFAQMERVQGCQVVCGTLDSLGGRQFDTIVYIDVLEHIERDRAELESAAARLRAGGNLVVLSPAHQRLFSRFDITLGHFRRYNGLTLRQLTPPGLQLRRLRYLDCMGLTASIANRLFLRQPLPTAGQLRLWDRWMIPVSRVLDRLLFYSAGKSILAIWQKI